MNLDLFCICNARVIYQKCGKTLQNSLATSQAMCDCIRHNKRLLKINLPQWTCVMWPDEQRQMTICN